MLVTGSGGTQGREMSRIHHGLDQWFTTWIREDILRSKTKHLSGHVKFFF
jgi:hypothetical protein